MTKAEHILSYFEPLTHEQFLCVLCGVAFGVVLGIVTTIVSIRMYLAVLRRQRPEDAELRAFRARSILHRP